MRKEATNATYPKSQSAACWRYPLYPPWLFVRFLLHQPKGNQPMTREQWLLKASDLMRPWFKEAGKPLPDTIHVSIGFTGSRSKKAIGACWAIEASADNAHQIYIVPTIDGELPILSVLAHELVHAALPTGTGHKKPFQTLAAAIGLEGPWKATTAGPELTKRLKAIAAKLGPIPHPLLTNYQPKKQTTRLRLWVCQCEEPIKLRVAKDELDITCNTCGELFQRAD